MIDNDKCPICGKAFHTGAGRSLRLTDEQIAGILAHCRAQLPKHTIKHYCESIGISPYSYNLIVRMQLRKQSDIERVLKIKAKLDSKETT